MLTIQNITLLPENSGPQLFDEQTFWTQFKQDLANARHSILIVSPFATREGCEFLLECLPIERGVKTAIVTRHTASQYEKESLKIGLQRLADAGIEMGFTSNFHHKVAVIDGRTAWSGSLNMLCKYKTLEIIHRFDAPSEVSKIIQHLYLNLLPHVDGRDVAKPADLKDKFCDRCQTRYVMKQFQDGNDYAACGGYKDTCNQYIKFQSSAVFFC